MFSSLWMVMVLGSTAATSSAVKSTEGVPSVFYNVKVSSILSKYFGESSKIVSELYGTARDTSPSVVFLDEFSSGMDPLLKRAVLDLLRAEASKGRTFVLTTHILTEAEESERVLNGCRSRRVTREVVRQLAAQQFDVSYAGRAKEETPVTRIEGSGRHPIGQLKR